MKERDKARAAALESALVAFSEEQQELPGIDSSQRRRVLVRQLIDSLHRVEYPRLLLERALSPRRVDPHDPEYFDPIRAAAFHRSTGNHDEACWLIFLFVHLGARPEGRWRLIREIYGGLGSWVWSWARVSTDSQAFAQWIEDHADQLQREGPGRKFGNHRKYESLKHMERTVGSYVNWVGPGGHEALFNRARAEAVQRGGDLRRETFDVLYGWMDVVWRFGRLAKFDYLAMVGKLDLASIEPGRTYIKGATGPALGARLLFAGDVNADIPAARLEELLRQLEATLGVGMQALEDAICNWQKRPASFKSFGG